MIQEFLYKQQSQLAHFYRNVDLVSVDRFIQFCLRTQGLLAWSGVGKSGYVAEKIAATLASTGTRAIYLSPTNFLHGDLGLLRQEDTLVLISKSGETNELIDIIPFARKKGATILSVVSNPNAKMASLSDHYVVLPLESELCPYDLAPTTSTVLQLLFGDLISMTLMGARGFTRDQYAENHPQGAIGKKVTIQVKDLMKAGHDLPTCYSDDRLMTVLVELSNKRCGCLLVVDPTGNLQGIFTDGDLRRTLQRFGAAALHEKMGNLMTASPAAIGQNALIVDALKKMQHDPKKWITALPVVGEGPERGRLIGLIRMHDLVQAGVF